MTLGGDFLVDQIVKKDPTFEQKLKQQMCPTGSLKPLAKAPKVSSPSP
jgi:hypothetical protein